MKQTHKKVIAAGHVCVDITPVFSGKKRENVTDVLLPGKLVQTGPATLSAGGSVVNAGLAMKRFGADVRLMGKVGSDDFGRIVCRILDQYEAAEGMIVSDTDATSYSVVLAIPGIDRMFLHCPGANDTFQADDISEEVLADAALFHFGYPPLMRSMYQDDGAELLKLMKKVRLAGCATSLDLAAVDPNAPVGRLDWKRILSQVIPYVDFFVPSIEELCYMLDRPRYETWQARAKERDITEILDVQTDIRPLADLCMASGCKVLLIKCGVFGLYYRTASAEKITEISSRLELDASMWADKEGVERAFRPDAVRSATGAGDTSIAAFLTGMLNGETPKVCAELAAAAGACCVSAYDTLSGLQPIGTLKQRIKAGWEKLEI